MAATLHVSWIGGFVYHQTLPGDVAARLAAVARTAQAFPSLNEPDCNWWVEHTAEVTA